MISLNSCSLDELKGVVNSFGEKAYRSAQIYRWLYRDKVLSIDEMTNLSFILRSNIAEMSEITSIKEISRMTSSKDGSVKLLFGLEDGERVESVILRDKDRVTACISTQVGCKMGCRFCATAGIGFKRNLKTAEILLQVKHLEDMASLEPGNEGRLSGIVLMGMGEPLDNFNNVHKALEILTDENAYGYSHRRVTLSTVGLVPKIKELFDKMDSPVNLAVSINASNQTVRKDIMPVSVKYPLEELVETLRALHIQKRKKITLEYVLLGGINDSRADALALVKLFKGIQVKINLIRYNGGGDVDLLAPGEKNTLDFQQVLIDNGLSAFIRKSLGADILGACGQLAAGYK